MSKNKYKDFYKQIKHKIPASRIFIDPINNAAYGTDASCYSLIPQVVIKAISEQEVRLILFIANQLKLPVTFRGSGTSLSGQAISDSILVILQEGWKNYKITNDFNFISLDTGVIASEANRYLSPDNKKIGPDPATVNVASIGGIVANNSSGMCCGVEQNSYQTIQDIRIILQDGTLLDTSDKHSVDTFRKTHANLLSELSIMRQEILEDKSLSDLIIKKYKIKNTTGYSLNSLVDFEDEIEILKHLIVGSEGTLAFISNVTYKTIKDYPYKATALILFKDTEQCCQAITKLKTIPQIVESAEFMDRIALKVMENEPNVPEVIKSMDEKSCAILIQTSSDDMEKLDDNINKIISLLNDFNLVLPPKFSKDPIINQQYWNIRKGIFTKVGALRRPNTVVIIEDITFMIEDLSSGVMHLRQLLNKYNFEDAVIFGHALDGNLHFVICVNFANEDEIKNYDNFMQALAKLVTQDYQGSLKAEHGTGRNIAPFVEKEWGKKAYSLMRRIKKLFDEKNLLNPDVIITDDPNLHLKNLKSLNDTNPLIDKCIECGFCEPTCPTKYFTFTPRQRIASLRYLKSNKNITYKIKKIFNYKSVDTCVACSLCSISCPVDINVGNLTKELKEANKPFLLEKLSLIVTKYYYLLLSSLRLGLYFGQLVKLIFGNKFMKIFSKLANKITFRLFPKWFTNFPKPANINNIKQLAKNNNTISTNNNSKNIIYFSSCLNKLFGEMSNHSFVKQNIQNTMDSLIKKSGHNMIMFYSNNSCCGMPFSSKGFKESSLIKSQELEQQLLEISNNGEYPIVSDFSSCTLQMVNNFKSDKLKIMDIGSFAYEYIMPNVEIVKTDIPIALHINCSAIKLGEKNFLIEIAKMCAKEVIIPESVSCCGFAGDKGMFYPEINAKSLQHLSEETKIAKVGFSTNTACEIGLSEHSKKPYTSILYLLDMQSHPKKT